MPHTPLVVHFTQEGCRFLTGPPVRGTPPLSEELRAPIRRAQQKTPDAALRCAVPMLRVHAYELLGYLSMVSATLQALDPQHQICRDCLASLELAIRMSES